MTKSLKTLRMNAVMYFVEDEAKGAVVPVYSKGLQKAIDPKWAIIWKEPVQSLNDEEKLIREAVKTERDLFIEEFVANYPSTGTAQNPRANARSNWKRVVDASLPEKPKGAGATEARPLVEFTNTSVPPSLRRAARDEDETTPDWVLEFWARVEDAYVDLCPNMTREKIHPAE